MDKPIYYIIAETDFETHHCKECNVTGSKEKHLKIAQDVNSSQVDILCDKCLEKYSKVIAKPGEDKFKINGIEYIEVPCEGCPGKKIKIVNKNENV